MDAKLYNMCKNQNVSSVFGFRRIGGETIKIHCINCHWKIMVFFNSLDIWGMSGRKIQENITVFEIPKSMAPFIKSFDMVRMLRRFDVDCFDFDEV